MPALGPIAVACSDANADDDGEGVEGGDDAARVMIRVSEPTRAQTIHALDCLAAWEGEYARMNAHNADSLLSVGKLRLARSLGIVPAAANHVNGQSASCIDQHDEASAAVQCMATDLCLPCVFRSDAPPPNAGLGLGGDGSDIVFEASQLVRCRSLCVFAFAFLFTISTSC